MYSMNHLHSILYEYKKKLAYLKTFFYILMNLMCKGTLRLFCLFEVDVYVWLNV